MKNFILLIIPLLLSLTSIAQTKEVCGIVKDDLGEPLPFVSVFFEGVEKAAQTDFDGKYCIYAPSDTTTLKFAFIGYEEVEEVVDGRDEINIVLVESSAALEEVEISCTPLSAKAANRLYPKKKDRSKRKGMGFGKSSVKNIESYDAAVPSGPAGATGAAGVMGRGSSSVSYLRSTDGAESAAPSYKVSATSTAVRDEKSSIKSTMISSEISKDDLSDQPREFPEIKEADTDNEIHAGILTAGEIHDFSKWEMWQDISSVALSSWEEYWDVKMKDRFTLQLMNEDGKPVIDAEVSLINEGNSIWKAKTDNTGKAELWANLQDELVSPDALLKMEVRYRGKKHNIDQVSYFKDGVNHLTIDAKCEVPNMVDLMWVVDATGSMGDEINYLKVELNDVIQQVKANNKDLEINMGSVFYRDEGDAYLTRQTEFSKDINKTIDFIKEQGADGGGDTPEAVEEALEVAIEKMKWTKNARARMLFLVLDAPPHQEPEVLEKLWRLNKLAASKGIRIIPITGSGIDKSVEYLMRAMALSTNGTYVFLTDHSGVGGEHIEPTTDDYDVEFLNDLLVRLIDQNTFAPDCNNDDFVKDALSDDGINDNNNQGNNNHPGPLPNMKLYPNPTAGPMTIELEEVAKELFITDYAGKIIRRLTNVQAGKRAIDLSDFPSGVYFVRYHNGKKGLSEKFVIAH